MRINLIESHRIGFADRIIRDIRVKIRVAARKANRVLADKSALFRVTPSGSVID